MWKMKMEKSRREQKDLEDVFIQMMKDIIMTLIT